MSRPAGWDAWSRTILRFGPGQLDLDLSEPVPPPARAAFGRMGLAGPFAVITPCNPRGHRLGQAENAARHAAFLGELGRLGVAHLPVDGCAPDGGHLEPGCAIVIPREEAIALARRWEQLGLYWWDGARFWIVPALGPGVETALPVEAVSGKR